VQPDLSDTLTGKETESIMNLAEDEATLKTELDKILDESTDPKIIEMIRTQ